MSGQGSGGSMAALADDDSGADLRWENVEAACMDACGKGSVVVEPGGVKSVEVEAIMFEALSTGVVEVRVEAVGVKSSVVFVEAIFMCVGQPSLHSSKLHAFWKNKL